MQLIKDRCAIRTGALSRAALMLMPGTMPATKEELLAAVNLTDWQDVYAKAVGCVEAVASPTNAIKFAPMSATTLTWLKGGAFAIPSPPAGLTGYYGMMPDRIDIDVAGVSAVTANRGFAHMFLHHTTDVAPNINYVKYIRREGEGELAYILKFNRTVKATHLLHYGQADSATGANHSGFKVSVRVDGDWVEVMNAARTSSKNAMALNAPTYGKEFRIEFTGFPSVSPAASTNKGIMLLTDEFPTDVPVPAVGWGILVNYGLGQIGTSAIYEIEKPQYGSMLPCIIGTISDPLGSGDFKISKVNGLVSSDAPSMADFKYYYGTLEVL